MRFKLFGYVVRIYKPTQFEEVLAKFNKDFRKDMVELKEIIQETMDMADRIDKIKGE